MSRQISDELIGIDLGDKRLNRRSHQVMESLSVDPQASVNASFVNWADTLAAYRLFDNDAVTPEAILKPHYEATLARIDEHPVVLIVQDTSELDFTKHPPKDAGCLNKADRFGFYNHTHLAVTPTGLPLGVVGVEMVDRSPGSLGHSLERRSLPSEEKESFRWLEGYRLASTVG
ncbi:MAG: transposase [Planctomycetes bacterium]|nr:transposase [Planctomycetota bacterium]